MIQHILQLLCLLQLYNIILITITQLSIFSMNFLNCKKCFIPCHHLKHHSSGIFVCKGVDYFIPVFCVSVCTYHTKPSKSVVRLVSSVVRLDPVQYCYVPLTSTACNWEIQHYPQNSVHIWEHQAVCSLQGCS